MSDYEDMHGKKDALYDESGHYDPRKGRSLIDDLLGWAPDFAFRVDAFPPHCLTISGAVSLAVGVVLFLGCFFNVVLPHYDRLAHSVQTRCKIVGIDRDEYIDDALFHYKVKFPLPGIPGLQQGESYCYGSQRCSAFELNSAHDCYFDTEDHTVRFYTAMSGHHTIRLFSYVILMLPFLFGACCCLIPASMHWNGQWRRFADDVKESWSNIPAPWKKNDDDEYYQGEDYDRSYQAREMSRGYARDDGAGYRYGSGGYAEPSRYQPEEPPQPGGGGEGGGWQSSLSYMRMQTGL